MGRPSPNVDNMTFRVRFFRLKHYLYIYNTVLRYARRAERVHSIIQWLTVEWNTFTEVERRFILARETW